MNRKAFYDALRCGALFPHGLSQGQVAGIERLLDVWDKYFAADSEFLLAYNLGTSFHETAETMHPITERGAVSYFDKYEPGTSLGKVLGNTVKGDGYRFRGEGDVQNTGRANALKASRRINEVFGLGLDLVANPDQRGDPFVSAISLFLGNKEGWWTGKDLLDYIDSIPESEQEDLREFTEARRVVNGTDKAAKIAGYAMEFYRAIQAAHVAMPAPKPDPIVQVETPSKVQPPAPSSSQPPSEPIKPSVASDPKTQVKPASVWAALFAAFAAFFKKG